MFILYILKLINFQVYQSKQAEEKGIKEWQTCDKSDKRCKKTYKSITHFSPALVYDII